MPCGAAGAGVTARGKSPAQRRRSTTVARAVGRARDLARHLQRAGRQRRGRPAGCSSAEIASRSTARRVAQMGSPMPTRRGRIPGPTPSGCEAPASWCQRSPPGNLHEMDAAHTSIAAISPSAKLVGGRGYDSNDCAPAWLSEASPPSPVKRTIARCNSIALPMSNISTHHRARSRSFKDWRSGHASIEMRNHHGAIGIAAPLHLAALMSLHLHWIAAVQHIIGYHSCQRVDCG